jgi:glycosyltransferase EpsD
MKMADSVLFCATVDYHFKAFHLPYMKWFKEQGWEVHVAASGEIDLPFTDVKYNVPIQRSPFNLKNVEAYNELKHIIDKNQYKIIHCHTPMGGVLARLAARTARSKGTKVIYTAHGFHFCKGAPWKNWVMYYPIEKLLSKYTDCLITINEEDFNLAQKKFKGPLLQHVPGVGVDTAKFHPISQKEKEERKKSYGYKADDFLLFYAAEFNANKNQNMLIEALALIKDKVPNAKLLLAGEGLLMENCKELSISLGLEKQVDFLGFRKDIEEILPMCDAAVASSLREGLPVNIMEAMACELPVIASLNRGHRELVKNMENGWVINPEETQEFANKMIYLAQSPDLRNQLGINGRKKIIKTYSINQILKEKSRIYQTVRKEKEVAKWAIH